MICFVKVALQEPGAGYKEAVLRIVGADKFQIFEEDTNIIGCFGVGTQLIEAEFKQFGVC